MMVLDGSELVTVRQNGVLVDVTVRELLSAKRDADVQIISATGLKLRTKDADTLIVTTSSSAVTLLVPPSSEQAFPIFSRMHFLQAGSGQVTFQAGAGVTIESPATLKMAAQYAMATLIKVDTDTWALAGYLATS